MNPDRNKLRSSGGEKSGSVLLFAGTTEGRQIARRLSELGYAVTVCVATQTGADYLEGIPHLHILTGRKDETEMEELMAGDYLCCIDATHPYAVMASAQIRNACEKTGLTLYRLLRKEVSEEELKAAAIGCIDSYLGECQAGTDGPDRPDRPDDSRRPGWTDKQDRLREPESSWSDLRITAVQSAQEACALLMNRYMSMQMKTPGIRILLTTGAREAGCFSPLLEDGRMEVFVRVLPVPESLDLCKRAGFSPERILSGWGPYSVRENVRALREHSIGILVTKDGGIEGGYPEKLAAACLCAAEVIVIQRPREEGLSEEEVLKRIRRDYSESSRDSDLDTESSCGSDV